MPKRSCCPREFLPGAGGVVTKAPTVFVGLRRASSPSPSEGSALLITRGCDVQAGYVHRGIDEAEGSVRAVGCSVPNPLPCGLSKNISRSISIVMTTVAPPISML
jgi:hypothetical protein